MSYAAVAMLNPGPEDVRVVRGLTQWTAPSAAGGPVARSGHRSRSRRREPPPAWWTPGIAPSPNQPVRTGLRLGGAAFSWVVAMTAANVDLDAHPRRFRLSGWTNFRRATI